MTYAYEGIKRTRYISSWQRVHMISVVMEDNLEEIEPLVHLAKKIGITYLVTRYSSGRGKKYRYFVSLPGYLERFGEAVSPCYAGKNLFNKETQMICFFYKNCYNGHLEVKMKKTCFVLLIVLLTTFICAGTVIPLHDLVKPWTINVDKARIYITEGIN